ncbi:amidohydrolase family protein [Prauserella sp. ASG 168]|uniref:Amidohydrolase family protein n=1 Tax=Prauserella cavernicola TaxID=2800127 RepID=A0A934V6T7_9PSEU|nr:amidohydrolase family protein [Prauserella cavernicola]
MVFVGGRVVDPASGLDAVTPVEIADGRVRSIGAVPATEATVLDVTGMTIAPGFIDLHSHGQSVSSMQMQALDGVTTALELEAGVSPVAMAYRLAANEGRPINYGFSASWAGVRMRVLGGIDIGASVQALLSGLGRPAWKQPASERELATVVEHLEIELGAGALGIGVLAGYAPETTREEYIEIARLARRHDVPTFTHARYKNQTGDSRTAYDGIAEIVEAARGTGAHMHVCHVNSTSLRAIDDVHAAVEKALAEGHRVTTEGYPYGAGMTAVAAPFLHPDNLPLLGIGPQNIVVARTGERIASAERLLELRGTTPGEAVIAHYLDEGEADDRDVMRRALIFPDTAVASDAIGFVTASGAAATGWPLPSDARSHPRSAGTFARFWRTMVRETGALSDAEAIRRLTQVPADILASVSPDMRRKGTLSVGSDADVVVFDPTAFTDRATYASPNQASSGMRHVLVGGEFVVRDNEMLPEARPGRAVRGAIR